MGNHPCEGLFSAIQLVKFKSFFRLNTTPS